MLSHLKLMVLAVLVWMGSSIPSHAGLCAVPTTSQHDLDLNATTYLALRSIHHWNLLVGSSLVSGVDHSSVDGSTTIQDVVNQARTASILDGTYASVRQRERNDSNVRSSVRISIVWIWNDQHQHRRLLIRLTITKIVQLDLITSCCSV